MASESGGCLASSKTSKPSEIQDENTKLEILGKTSKQGSLIAVLELVGQLSEVCRIVVAAL